MTKKQTMLECYTLPNDECGWKLLKRAYEEYLAADNNQLKMVKRKSIQMLLFYGWKEVFRENLNESKTGFRSEDDAKRFDCLF